MKAMNFFPYFFDIDYCLILLRTHLYSMYSLSLIFSLRSDLNNKTCFTLKVENLMACTNILKTQLSNFCSIFYCQPTSCSILPLCSFKMRVLLVLFIWFQFYTAMTSRICNILTLISRVLEKEALYPSKLLVSTCKTAWQHKQKIAAGTGDAMKA